MCALFQEAAAALCACVQCFRRRQQRCVHVCNVSGGGSSAVCMCALFQEAAAALCACLQCFNRRQLRCVPGHGWWPVVREVQLLASEEGTQVQASSRRTWKFVSNGLLCAVGDIRLIRV